jgi:hypothetical protein
MKRAMLVVLAAVATLIPVAAQSPEWTSLEPAPRTSHSAIFDPVTSRMVVFGGVITAANSDIELSAGALGDLWRLNNRRWQPVQPKGTRPAARAGHSAVYDPATNEMIVYGGALPYAYTTFSDVWVLTHANGVGGASKWMQLNPTGTPTRRFQHGAAYDALNNRMIVFGGDDCTGTFCNVLSDVWVLSNANGVGGTPAWTQLTPEGGGPGTRETAGSVAYDSSSNRLIVFGGTNGSGVMYNDVWVLTNANGLGGTPTWIQLIAAGPLPEGRGLHTAVYDPVTNRLTVFGGLNAGGALLGDVWILSNANGLGGSPAWTPFAPFSVFPEARAGHSAVYDPGTNRMVVFGGTPAADFTLGNSSTWFLSHANGQ